MAYTGQNRKLEISLLLLVVLSTCRVAESIPDGSLGQICNEIENTEDIKEFFATSVRFSLRLYKVFANHEKAMFALSTANIFEDLSQLLIGASETSQRQLHSVLHYHLYNYRVQQALRCFVETKKHLKFTGLSMENYIFHGFKSDLRYSFTSAMQWIFGRKPFWLKSSHRMAPGDLTYGLAKVAGIPHPQYQTFDEEESFVLFSAAMFSSKFVAHNCFRVFRSNFYYDDGTIIDHYEYVHTIGYFVSGEFNYKNSNNEETTAQYIELAWRNIPESRIKTILIRPKARHSIADLEKSLDAATMFKILSNTDVRLINAMLPRYIDMKSAYDLTEPLKNMGSNEALNKTTVLHQVNIALTWINEETLWNSSCQLPPYTFSANRAFMILNVFKGDYPFILSMGRYGSTHPAANPDLVNIV